VQIGRPGVLLKAGPGNFLKETGKLFSVNLNPILSKTGVNIIS
jgi:hypothetical protein